MRVRRVTVSVASPACQLRGFFTELYCDDTRDGLAGVAPVGVAWVLSVVRGQRRRLHRSRGAEQG